MKNNKGINVLSCFDGMSCGRIALERVGIKVDNYYSSEIDKYAIQIANKNYPQDEVNRLGDVTKWGDWNIDWSSIDLVTGGFPCQAWSISGKQLGDKDERGILFWDMLYIMKKVLEHNPKAKFLIENVKMKKEFEEYITLHTTNALGKVNKHLINSELVSGQNRQRYYWTNIENIKQPPSLKVKATDILERSVENKFNISEVQLKRLIGINTIRSGYVSGCFTKKLVNKDKTETLMARDYKGISGKQYYPLAYLNNNLRRLTPKEYERLQTVPDNYTEGVSNTQRYKMLGNGWTVDVIAHIFKGLKNE